MRERYGTVITPEQIDVTKGEYPWIQQYSDCSATELEILYALFPVGQNEDKQQETLEQALFYFRELPTDKELDKPQQDLRQRIRDLDCQITDYQKPADLKDIVIEQLWALIDRDFPEGSLPTAQERENLEHDSFAENQKWVYIPQQFGQLTEYVEGDSTKPLMVMGKDGIGKSALLANWAIDYRQQNPETLVIWHFCGCSESSTNFTVVVQRITEHLQKHFLKDNKIPYAPEALMQCLSSELAQNRVIIIIDGLNQLENLDNLAWLLDLLPDSVRLIVTPNHKAGQILRQVKGICPTLTVKPLSDQATKQLIVDYLGQYGKQLDDHHIENIITAPHNPLYLRILLEELRLSGRYDNLKKRN